ncbi:azurin [Myroides guanonis]|uniref:Azurin n=1 Tax=Myroides guanonis TaxID=1150112 RepID=A0A1I3NG33_9FLAO|nr:azurin [Myroides guanonis]SFJ08263.1 azurin [Myroides guanonis]
MKKVNTLLSLTAASFLLFSCGDKTKDTTPASEVTPTETTTTTPEAVSGVTVEISADDSMQFNKKEIRVPVGEKVTLTLKHTGKMDKKLMGHNFVLLNQGVDMAAFAQKAATSTDSDHIPADELSNILAHTKMIGGGESTTIEFTVDKAGTYDFLCSFPAHYALMQGKLIAE